VPHHPKKRHFKRGNAQWYHLVYSDWNTLNDVYLGTIINCPLQLVFSVTYKKNLRSDFTDEGVLLPAWVAAFAVGGGLLLVAVLAAVQTRALGHEVEVALGPIEESHGD